MFAFTWVGVLWLVLAGVFFARALSGSIWIIALSIVGTIAASYLVMVLLALSMIIPSWHRHVWRPVEREFHRLVAGDAICLDSPAVAAETPRPQPAQPQPTRVENTSGSLTPAEFAAERAEIERLWQQGELERRLWHVGSLSGGLLAWLIVAAAYLKLDLGSSGRYRTRLRLASAAGVSLATAAAAWAWTVPV